MGLGWLVKLSNHRLRCPRFRDPYTDWLNGHAHGHAQSDRQVVRLSIGQATGVALNQADKWLGSRSGRQMVCARLDGRADALRISQAMDESSSL